MPEATEVVSYTAHKDGTFTTGASNCFDMGILHAHVDSKTMQGHHTLYILQLSTIHLWDSMYKHYSAAARTMTAVYTHIYTMNTHACTCTCGRGLPMQL